MLSLVQVYAQCPMSPFLERLVSEVGIVSGNNNSVWSKEGYEGNVLANKMLFEKR